jgi:predicted aminopeptidase
MNIGKMVKRGFVLALSILVILGLWYWDLVLYGIRQGKGQLQIVWLAKPVEVYLNDNTFPDSLKAKLVLIQDVRQYAIDSLGLRDTKNYKTLYDQKGKELLWVVTASEPFRLIAKEWNFPVLGAVPYKGFFNHELALAEQKRLEKEGWDVTVRNPGGWSTLGWFTDPILSGMLSRSTGDLANLIIHEMVHATIFVKDSVEFNENLASFIGDRGTEKYLADRYGVDSQEVLQYSREDQEYNRIVAHMLGACDYLDSVYTSIAEKPLPEKRLIKEHSIRHIMEAVDTLQLEIFNSPSKKYLSQLPNNAYFMSFRRYQSKQDDFWSALKHDFSGDLRAFIAMQAKQYPFL